MIKGIGTDIIELSRVEEAAKKESFLKKVYTENEINEYIKRGKSISYLAGRFAAKEAVSKAFGTGMRGISFLDIEILSDNSGKPIVNIKKDILSNFTVHITISHSRENAVAFCVIEGE